MNALTGFQIIAINGLQNGQGLSVPNIGSLLSEYESFPPVANFITIYNSAPNAAITPTNVIALQNIGANSFPQLFGAVPFVFSTNLGIGILIPQAEFQVNKIFGNVNSASIFVQALSLAQSYASQSADTINSAASATWNGNPENAISGGVCAIAGNNEANIAIVAQAFSQLGDVVQVNSVTGGFSAAAIFQEILDTGNDTIGNLHLNFFGKTIVDPTTGNTYVVNADLMTLILNNPVALPNSTFPLAAQNPLDIQLQMLANQALALTGDLDAVITFVGINGNAASNINQFSDCLNPQLMLGPAAGIIANVIGTPQLTASNFLQALVDNITGLNNVSNLPALGVVFGNTKPLGNLNLLAQMNAPVSPASFANLQAQLGPGSGANGNPTVADILGSTNIAGALTTSIAAINQLVGQTLYLNISTDTSNVANVLVNGWPGTEKLSNGNTYTDANLYCSDAANLINLDSSLLALYAANIGLANNFSEYNILAETQNNSRVLLTKAGINIANIQNSISSLVSFGSTLNGLALENVEVSGLDVIEPVIQNTDLSGQALSATIIEAQNNQVFGVAGIVSSAFQSNLTPLTTPPLGANLIGG